MSNRAIWDSSDKCPFCSWEAYVKTQCLASSTTCLNVGEEPANNQVKVVSQVAIGLRLGGQKFQKVVYFVEGLLMPPLEKPVIGKFGFIIFLDGIDHGEDHDCKMVYYNLFRELRVMSTEVRIQIKRDASIFKLHIGTLQQIENDHCKMRWRMVKWCAIEKVERPTEWCSPAIVSKKRKIRRCVDSSRLNKAIKHEHHLMRHSMN